MVNASLAKVGIRRVSRKILQRLRRRTGLLKQKLGSIVLLKGPPRAPGPIIISFLQGFIGLYKVFIQISIKPGALGPPEKKWPPDKNSAYILEYTFDFFGFGPIFDQFFGDFILKVNSN